MRPPERPGKRSGEARDRAAGRRTGETAGTVLGGALWRLSGRAAAIAVLRLLRAPGNALRRRAIDVLIGRAAAERSIAIGSGDKARADRLRLVLAALDRERREIDG